MGKLNPFNNSSFETSSFVTAPSEVDELGRPVVVSAGASNRVGGGNAGPITTSDLPGTLGGPKVYTVRGRRILVPAGLDEDEAQAYANRIADSADRTDELIAETAEIRARIEARRAGNATNVSTAAQGIVINVNAPSAIDTEGFTRSVIQALNESQSRTGSLDTLAI